MMKKVRSTVKKSEHDVKVNMMKKEQDAKVQDEKKSMVIK
jgi:hypothetical protein